MRAYYEAPLDEQYRERYSGVGAGTTNSKSQQRFTSADKARTQPTVDRLKQQASQAAQTRNVQVEGRSTGAGRPGGAASSGQTIDQSFNQSYAQQGLQPTYAQQVSDTRNKVTRAEEVQYKEAQRQAKQKKVASKVAKIARVAGPAGAVVGAVASFGLTQFARARATAINAWLISWGLWFWIMIQVPLALFLLFSIGLAGFIQALWWEIQNAGVRKDEDTGLLSAIWAGVVGVGASAIEMFADLIVKLIDRWSGINLHEFDPNQFVTLIYALNVTFGVIALLSVYIAYRFTFLRPLGGRAAGAKYAAVAIALAMYSVPIANLLPWFMLWCAVVWFFPR